MPFISAGNNVTQRIVFNSGTLDFGNSRLVEMDSVNLSIEWTLVPLYVLNSIRAQDLVRHSEKVTLTGKIKSYAPEMEEVALGASTPGTPNEIDTLDGQPTLQNPVITLYDRNGKEIQYQLVSAVFRSTKFAAKIDDYAEFDFELEAIDIKEVYTS